MDHSQSVSTPCRLTNTDCLSRHARDWVLLGDSGGAPAWSAVPVRRRPQGEATLFARDASFVRESNGTSSPTRSSSPTDAAPAEEQGSIGLPRLMSLSSSHSYSVFRSLAMRYCNSFIPFLIYQSHASPELVSSSRIPIIEDRSDTLSSADSRSEAAASIQLCRTGSNTPAGSRLEVAIVLTGLGA